MAERNEPDLTSVGDDRQQDGASVSRSATSSSATGGARSSGGRSNRGFASMDPQRQREIASKGGRAAHAKGTAHEWSSDEARVAGRKGGEAVSRDRAHMAQIGREGGEARGKAARAQAGNRASQNGAGGAGNAGGAGGADQRNEGNRA